VRSSCNEQQTVFAKAENNLIRKMKEKSTSGYHLVYHSKPDFYQSLPNDGTNLPETPFSNFDFQIFIGATTRTSTLMSVCSHSGNHTFL
jgi:hypothetical protein